MTAICEPMSRFCEWQPTQNYRAAVHNTFLRFTEVPDDDEDEWMIRLDPRRVVTDNAVADKSFRAFLEQSYLQNIQTHLSSSRLGEAEAPIKKEDAGESHEEDGDRQTVKQEEDAGKGHEEDGDGQTGKQVSPRILEARQVAANGGGLSGLTTVMVAHIPSKYTKQKLMREVNNAGFLGKYDFFNLPVQPHGRGNRGFAFFNFCDSEAAEVFYTAFHGRQLMSFSSEVNAAVMPAYVQGFERNAEHYASMRHGKGMRTSLQSSRPLFFKPLPPHLMHAEGTTIEVVSHDRQHDDRLRQAVHQVPVRTEPSPGWGAGNYGAAPTEPGRCTGGSSVSGFNGDGGNWQRPGAHQAMAKRFCCHCRQIKLPEHDFCTFCGTKVV